MENEIRKAMVAPLLPTPNPGKHRIYYTESGFLQRAKCLLPD